MPSRKRQSTMYVFPPSSLCNCRWLLNWTNLFRTRRRARKAQTAVAVTAMTTTSKIPPSLPTPRPFPPCITTLQVDLVYIPYNSLASSLFFSVSINALPRLSSLIIRLCFVFLFYSFFFYSGDSSVLARSFLKRLNLYKWPTLLLLILLVT